MKRLIAPVGRIVPVERILRGIARVTETLLKYSLQKKQKQTGEEQGT
jgi:hypothetical protein